jgi:hypothetical protein
VASRFKVLFGDAATPATDVFYNRLKTLEVEENADLPAAIQLTLKVDSVGAPGAQDLTVVGEEQFKPYARAAVVISVDNKPDACIFDGYVLSQAIHLDKGVTSSSVRVWGQDVSCLMNRIERTREWSESDGTIANTIFRDNYQFGTSSENTTDDSGSHPDDGHTVMQRATDAQFLRDRARRSGRLFRVACTTRPGNSNNTGYFIKPKLDGTPAAALILNPVASANVDAFDIEWDVARPTEVTAHALIRAKDSVDGGVTDSGLTALDSQTLTKLVGTNAMKVMLTASVDDAGELSRRARSILREASWFVKCEGEVSLARLGTVLRVASLVEVKGAGKLHSGNYFVWSVRHTITAVDHRMKFVLLRNAIGSP